MRRIFWRESLKRGRRGDFAPQQKCERGLQRSLIESTLGHYLRLSLVVLVSEAFNVLEQHLGVAG